jgi:chromosome segregation ATPase
MMGKKAQGALEQFEKLEERIADAIKVLEETQRNKATADKKLAEARRQIQGLQGELEGLRKERKLVRVRVKGLITSIVELSKEHKEQVV